MMGGGGMMMGRQMMGMGHGRALAKRAVSGSSPSGTSPASRSARKTGRRLPLIFEAGVGKARDTVVLKLTGAVPAKASLWYGYGLDPYCNLTDGSDMAVPVFGPIALDDSRRQRRAASPQPSPATAHSRDRSGSAAPVKVLIITGDNVSAHNWQENSKAVEDILEKDGRIKVDITATPSKDLTDENLAKYDVLLLNYKETPAGPPDSRWSDSNKAGISQGRARGQGAGRLSFCLECLHQAQLGRV